MDVWIQAIPAALFLGLLLGLIVSVLGTWFI